MTDFEFVIVLYLGTTLACVAVLALDSAAHRRKIRQQGRLLAAEAEGYLLDLAARRLERPDAEADDSSAP